MSSSSPSVAPMELNENTFQHLSNFLRQSLGVDGPASVIAATKEFEVLCLRPGFALCLLQIIAKAELPLDVKQAASIQFKNVVMQHWIATDPSDTMDAKRRYELMEGEKVTIKQHLVNIMLTSHKLVQTQLGQALAIISSSDFPDQWNTLLPELVQKLTTPVDTNPPVAGQPTISTNQYHIWQGILDTLHSITYRYRHESSSKQLWSEIKYVVDHFAPAYLTLFQKTCNELSTLVQLSSSPAPPANLLESFHGLLAVIQVLLEIYHNLIVQELTDFFVDNSAKFLPPLQALLNLRIPLWDNDSAQKDKDQETATSLENIQMKVCDIVTLYTQKYEDDFKDYVPAFVQEAWNLMVRLNDSLRYDLLVTSAIKFLTAVTRKGRYKELFNNEGALKNMCEKVVIPQLKLRESDLDTYNSDAIEYIRRDIEGSDVDTRRRTTVEFIRGLCENFEAQITSVLKMYVENLLQNFAQNQNNLNGILAKDCAMYIVMALSAKASTASKGVVMTNPYVDIGSFFETQVLPELTKKQPSISSILLADALKFTTIFRSQFPADVYVKLFPLFISHLASEEVVIHTYAAHAIERLLSVKEEGDHNKGTLRMGKEELKPFMKSSLESLFKVLFTQEESRENEYIMKAIVRVCAVDQEVMLPFVSVILSSLTSILERVSKNPKNPAFNHSLFEAVACLVHNLCKADVSLVGAFENALFPPFQAMLSMESAGDFSPYVFQILAQLLEFRKDLSNAYTSIFPALLVPSLWMNLGNVPALVRLIQAYLARGVFDAILSKDTSKIDALLGVFQKLLASKTSEQRAIDLLSFIIEYIPANALQKYFAPILSLIFARLQNKPSDTMLKGAIYTFSLIIVKYNFDFIVQITNSIQPGVFAVLFAKVVLLKIREKSLNFNDLYKRMITAAFTQLLYHSPSFTSSAEYADKWGPTFHALVCVLQPRSSLPKLNMISALGDAAAGEPGADGDEDDLLVQSQKAFSTAFAKLAFAPILLSSDFTKEKVHQDANVHFKSEHTNFVTPAHIDSLKRYLSLQTQTDTQEILQFMTKCEFPPF